MTEKRRTPPPRYTPEQLDLFAEVSEADKERAAERGREHGLGRFLDARPIDHGH
jgi:hypothetical protein